MIYLAHPTSRYDWLNGNHDHRQPLGVRRVRLDEQRLETVAFLCVEEKTSAGLDVVPRATVFFVGDDAVDRPHPVWAVTARHNIQEVRALGGAMFIRVNAGDSYVDIPTEADDWFESDEADVACCYWASDEGDVIALPLGQLVQDDLTYRFGHLVFEAQVMDPDPIYVGADVFVVGLFSQHAGRSRNLPVARFGNVARLPREPITVERQQGTEQIEGYLVEARSWGGVSGSPAYWAHPITQVVEIERPPQGNRAERRAQQRIRPAPLAISRELPFVALLGLVSAHFDIPRDAVHTGDVLGKVTTPLNSGMAVVTPAHFIRQLIDREDVREQAESYRREYSAQSAATMDILDEGEPSAAELTEYENFEDLTRKLVQTPKPEIDEKRKGS